MSLNLYEINTRSWIKQFGKDVTLKDIPDGYWTRLKAQGMDYVWLMGVWETTAESIEACCFHPDLVRVYDHTDPDWKTNDVQGSPYAIEDYQVSSLLGSWDDLAQIYQKIKKSGLYLILDFIPNHFNAYSQLVTTHPEVFIEVSESIYSSDPHSYFRRNGRYFAHGRDPYFPAWTDTAQINYSSPATHQLMTERIQQVATVCDGVRCDMAMLVLPELFLNTWGAVLGPSTYVDDFWSVVIAKIKNQNPGFLFIAESYWDTEWTLQQMGFDYTYDKKLHDLLVSGDNYALKGHLRAEEEYQRKSLHFIENHDEPRSMQVLGETRSKAAAVIMSTSPGMHLFYDGQWEGHRIKMPVQLSSVGHEAPCPCPLTNRLTVEERDIVCACQYAFYTALTTAIDNPVLKEGRYHVIDNTNVNLHIRQWSLGAKSILVIVNYSDQTQNDTIILHHKVQSSTHDLLNERKNPDWIQFKSDQELEVNILPYKSSILELQIKTDSLRQG